MYAHHFNQLCLFYHKILGFKMDEFEDLLAVIERLLAPDGCPWDREQTLQTMRALLLEETCEVIEAIDIDNNLLIEEELGDLFFNVVFLSKLAEKERRFTLKDVLRHITAKLIRRHPHIFGEANVNTSEEVLKQWEAIKQAEKGNQAHRSALEGIPKGLPSLARAQKMGKKLRDLQFFVEMKAEDFPSVEDRAGQALWELVQQLAQQGISAEEALRKRLAGLEEEFRAWENTI